MKLKEIDKKEFIARLDNSFEEKIKAAFKDGFNRGHDAGSDEEKHNIYYSDHVDADYAYDWWKKEQDRK